MTYKDILLKLLSEISPEPEEKLIEKIEFMKKLAPGSKLEKELPEEEARTLLEDLRREKPAILLSLIKASLRKPPFDA